MSESHARRLRVLDRLWRKPWRGQGRGRGREGEGEGEGTGQRTERRMLAVRMNGKRKTVTQMGVSLEMDNIRLVVRHCSVHPSIRREFQVAPMLQPPTFILIQ